MTTQMTEQQKKELGQILLDATVDIPIDLLHEAINNPYFIHTQRAKFAFSMLWDDESKGSLSSSLYYKIISIMENNDKIHPKNRNKGK